MIQKELNEILRKHKLWLEGEEGGERAYLSDSDLRYSDLRGSDLSGSDLRGSDLRGSNLRGCNLLRSNLRGSDLRGSNLRGCNLRRSDLSGSDLRDSDLRGSDLSGSDLRDADCDYSAWPLCCGSLKAHVDDRIAVQLLYHALSVVQHSPHVSEELKKQLLNASNVEAANRFHIACVEECGKLKEYDGGNDNATD